MPNGPKFSIVTPCFNSAATIRETLESVTRQDYKDWEQIVIDGGSTDDTLAIIAGFPGLRVLSEKDEGQYDAMNKGIRLATGRYIVILNADDCFRPGALARVATALDEHPDWDALFGDVIHVDAGNREIYRRVEAGYDFGVLLYALDYICHQTLFVRREIYTRLGGYRHRDFTQAADFELKLRLGRAGCRIGHVPAYLVNYRFHAAGQSADRRVVATRQNESARVRADYGNPGRLRGRILGILYKAKRQAKKLLLRGRIDLISGERRLRSHMMDKTDYSSNARPDKS